MKNFNRFRFSFIVGFIALLTLPLGVSADVFDEELANLLEKPNVTRKTLSDGSVITTISVSGDTAGTSSNGGSNSVSGGNPTGGDSAGYITLADGSRINFIRKGIATTFVSSNGSMSAVCTGITCSGNSTLSQSVRSSLPTINANEASTTVLVTEKVPGAVCKCFIGGSVQSDATCETANVEKRVYQCTVQKGMTSFQNMIQEIVRWFVYIIMLLGVLALVGAGILWAWGSESEEYTKKAKEWALNIIIGLVILFSFRYILGFLAPWIFQ